MKKVMIKIMHFFLVFTKNRKKFDKFVKINRLRNKTIIDIQRLVADENININDKKDLDYLKVLVFKMINLSTEKNKNVYYIPWLKSDFDVNKIFGLKQLPQISNFNLLFFYKDFENDPIADKLLSSIDKFNNTQILEDY